MAEGNSSKINNNGVSTEQPAFGQTNIPSALTATRDSIPWLKNKFIRSALNVIVGLLICITLYSIYVFTRHADPAEVFIFSAARYSPDKPFTLLVLARDAKKELPLDNQSVDLYMGPRDKDKEFRKLPSVKTGRDGIALVSIPPCPAGDYQIKAVIRNLTAVSNIEVKSVYKTMLTSDKPMYQPGQTIHLRSLTLKTTDLHPAPENNVNFKIHDPNGNLVLDQTAKSSAYGIAAANFQLADQVNTGEYKITVSEGQRETEKSVEVKNYRLPNYKIALNTDKKFYAPGDTVTGTVDANYIWGAPLANAKITLTASVNATKVEPVTNTLPQSGGRRGRGWINQRSYTTTYATIEKQLILANVKGVTDNAGRLNFRFQLPALDRVDFEIGAKCKITVNALSPAEHKQELSKALIITTKPLNISFAPEFGQLLPGVPGNLYLFVSDPYGDPVEAELKIGSRILHTGKNGLVLLPVSSAFKEMQPVTAFDRLGHMAEQKINLNYNTDLDAFILKTVKSVMNTGDQLQLEIISNNAGGQVFIDFVKDNTSLLLLPVKLNDKQTRLNFKIPAEIFGTIQLHAYRILPQGKIVRDLRLIQVHPDNQLTVKSIFSKPEYRPGETAQVNFQVKDQGGKPVQAALSIAAVDEMIFARQPDNIVAERAYFLLQEELLKPDYQNQASETLMSDNPSAVMPDAGYLLENKQNISNLQVACCSKYAERENPLVSKKIAFGNDLSLCLLVFVLILFLLFNIPFLMICLKGNSEPYWLVVEKRYWKDTQRTLIKLQLIFAAATLFSLFFIPCLLMSDSIGMYVEIIKHKINFVLLVLLFAGFMFLLAKAFKARNHIFQYLSASNVRTSQKIILLLPWIYAFFIFTFFCFLLSAIYFPNTPGLSGLSAFFAIISLFPTLYISGVRYVICSKEDFELRCQSRSNLGSGIGKYPGGYLSIWLIACFLYTGPIVFIYSFFVLMIIALFMPLTKIIDKLGGDGRGYYHGSTSSREEYFKLANDGQYFDLSGGSLCKANLPYVRRFFPETLYWQPQLITDEQGNASISFNVADSITSYRFNASAISRTGQLGSVQKELRVFQEFFVDFNPPENITSGDIISIPVVLYNYMKEPQQLSVTVQPDKAFSIIVPVYPVTLPPQSVTKSYLKVKFEHAAETKMLLTAIGKNCKDAIEKTVNIVPIGKKETIIISDVLQKSAHYKAVIPSNAILEGRDFYMKIYPTPLPKITDTLKNMLQQPFGCFEQTSSITYPNILILRFLDSSGQLMPDIRKQALKYINQGYQRLLTFEVSDGGFSLYGCPPAQIRLSAYGLMLFADMEKVRTVDMKVIERTAEWLKKRQNGNGSWTSDYDRVSNLALTAFVTMALTKSDCGGDAVTEAGKYIIEQARSCQDPYTLALCANALLKLNREQSVIILERLQAMRKENNEQCIWWESSGCGVFYSCRKALDTETTSLIASAMLSAGKYPETSRKAVIWLYREGINNLYSGHTLVQVMSTLINYGAIQPQFKTGSAFNLTIGLNGTIQSVVINDKSINLLQYLPFKQALRDGENIMTASGDMSGMMGFQGVATYYLPNPTKTQKNISKSTLDLAVAYSRNSLRTGETATCKIYLKNKGGNSVPMGIITMPIPPGFEVITAPLDNMVKNGVIDRFETGSNRLTLYFREFAVGKPLLLCIDLKALYPVEITAPALTAYPYYEPDNVARSIPEKLTVTQANSGV